MKTLGLIFLCLSTLTVGSRGSAACQYQPMQSAKANRATEFIKSISGSYQSRDCKMTIETCERAETPVGSTVAHILVVDEKGREAYLPIDFQETDAKRTRYTIQNGSRMFHYEYRDLNPDPAGGRRAVYYFEAVKTSDLTKLEYIELGVLEYPHTRVQWTTCSFN